MGGGSRSEPVKALPMPDPVELNPFADASEAQWRAAVERALKGADFDKALVSRLPGGPTIQPLYARARGARPITGETAAKRWRVSARVDHPEAEAASAQALADLEGGADALALVFHGSASARGFGLSTLDAAGIDAALAGVEIDLVALRLEPAPQARITARLMAEVVKRRKLSPADLSIAFGFDPVGLLARSGALLAPWPDLALRLRDMLSEFAGLGFRGPFFSCDARIVHEAGGSPAQELGYALASAAAYLRALESHGVETAERALSFTLAVDQDQLVSIAKLRAMRRLATQLQQACGVPARPIDLHAETAWRMLTRRDTPVNMLRNAIAAFSAGVGGADSVTVLPHTSALGLPDGFARRVGRNTQHVLLEESHLWRVADPAAGSGGFEALTNSLCAEGWEAFRQIEREGGIIRALETGALQERIAAVRSERERLVGTGKASLTGTSAFPDLKERAERALAVAPSPMRPVSAGAVTAEPLPSERAAEPFERLRDRADALAASGTAPQVFLAILGTTSSAAARTGFASGFLAAGGMAGVTSGDHAEADGATDLIAMTEAFKASGATIACLCGSDDRYREEAVDAAMALAASGARGIWLAGRPGPLEPTLRGAGMEGFIFAGCDMPAALGGMLDCLAAT